MPGKSPLFAACLVVLLAPMVSAEIIVSIGSVAFQQGQTTAFVDVTIADPSSSVNLNQFGFVFQITPIGNSIPELMFIDPQPQPFSDSRYVFYQDSLADPGPLGDLSNAPGFPPNTTYSGSDGTLDSNDVNFTGSKLITRLEIGVNPSLIQSAGSFQIALVPGSYDGHSTPDANTFFASSDGMGGANDLAFSSTPGTVTVPAVVPEPSSILLVAAGALCVPLAARARRAIRANGPAEIRARRDGRD